MKTENKIQNYLEMWIVSLITCCVLVLVFAKYAQNTERCVNQLRQEIHTMSDSMKKIHKIIIIKNID